MLGLGVWALSCVSAQLRCTDAAATGARAAARGDPEAAVVAAARSVAPEGATVTVVHDGERVRVVVRAVVRPLGGALATIGGVDVSGRGVAQREDVIAGAGAP